VFRKSYPLGSNYWHVPLSRTQILCLGWYYPAVGRDLPGYSDGKPVWNMGWFLLDTSRPDVIREVVVRDAVALLPEERDKILRLSRQLAEVAWWRSLNARGGYVTSAEYRLTIQEFQEAVAVEARRLAVIAPSLGS
jgi:hypothetical protein